MRTKIWFTLYQDIYREDDWKITIEWENPRNSEKYDEILQSKL